jgi:hypothetical protein
LAEPQKCPARALRQVVLAKDNASNSRVEPSYISAILGPKGRAMPIKSPGEQACCDVDKLD